MADMEALASLARAGDMRALRELLEPCTAGQIVDEVERLDGTARAVAFRALHKDRALEVFEALDPSVQTELLEGLRDEATVELVAAMDPDDRASLLDELPASVANRLLSSLDPAEREMTTVLLGYAADSVGRRMTPEVLAVHDHATVAQALADVRTHGAAAETVYLLPVVAEGRVVVGVVSLRRLLFTDDHIPVRDVMSAPVMVVATADREAAARLVREEGLLALPVVDHEDRLLGLFTVDDAMRVLEDEESEDIARSGAAEPLRRPYLTTSVTDLVRSRLGWLLVLIVAATMTVNVIGRFEDVLAQVVSLALFVPLLIGTAGNAGAQAATTVIRALAVGDVRFADLPRVVGRELLTGLLLGSGLAAISYLPASLLVDPDIALVLAAALIVVCTLATFIGSLVPLVATRVRVDPAVMSAPFITTLVDATGLLVYFLIARAVLGL